MVGRPARGRGGTRQVVVAQPPTRCRGARSTLSEANRPQEPPPGTARIGILTPAFEELGVGTHLPPTPTGRGCNLSHLGIEGRRALGGHVQLDQLAAQLTGLPVDVSVTSGMLATREPKRATTTVPIGSSSREPTPTTVPRTPGGVGLHGDARPATIQASRVTPAAWLWIPVTIGGVAQTLRNTAQRHLTGSLATLGATLLRFA